MEAVTVSSRRPAAHSALLSIFTSAARVAVLRVFMLDPLREYYQRQIESATGLPIRAVQREMERLTAASLLFRRTEGNRIYYRVDQQFPLFPELRSMVLKTSAPEEQFRGMLAVDDSVRLALLCAGECRALVVTETGAPPRARPPAGFTLDVLSTGEFLEALAQPESLESYLRRGVDLLGRREDVLWRRLEAGGHWVQKGEGVP